MVIYIGNLPVPKIMDLKYLGNVKISGTHFLDTSRLQSLELEKNAKNHCDTRAIYNTRAKNAIMTTAALNDLIWVANDEE